MCVGQVTCEVVNMDVGLVGSLPLVIFWSRSHCYWQHLVPGWSSQDYCSEDDNEWQLLLKTMRTMIWWWWWKYFWQFWQYCSASNEILAELLQFRAHFTAQCTWKSPKLTQVHWQRTFLWCSPDSWSFQKQGRTCNRCPGRHSDRAIFTIISNIYKSTKYVILTKLIKWSKDLFKLLPAVRSTC